MSTQPERGNPDPRRALPAEVTSRHFEQHHASASGNAGPAPYQGRPGPPAPATKPTPAPLSWVLIVGLGALTLLWPLTAASPIADEFGGPERALVLRSVIAIAWIAVVLLARVARPLATLTLAGLASGVITLLVDVILAPAGLGEGLIALPFAAIPILAVQTLFGAVTGLIALGLQRLLR
ncbi:hypothetical protein EXU48_01310 [Occultella glacieicola]|uniref:Uncharacterized protein n=1 Tax=Occultella glacieicola TaxID=2518684 RepID=A0ABY2E8Q2_9MICO|nr:hypothetical protein [Occultella glacieicola]TDE98867.1 hypothetical protein EXU48_01310 [Occultella glacieicola]